jgi:hypothetical protein
MLPVATIPENYLYALLPQGVIDLDKKKLIEAVIGGYQDRVSDLRSYINAFGELIQPDADLPQFGFNVILVKFSGSVGQVITRSLDLLPDTPPLDDVDALTAWAVTQLGFEDDSTIISVVAGTDLLRQIDLDSISLLADNVGALLYPGLNDETEEDQRQTRQRLLETWFPLLKIKGTVQSFETLGRIIGFDQVAVTPLWSRLVPQLPNDPGNSVNNGDFSARPEQVPSANLPDVRYDPLDLEDGVYYDWNSGPLSEDPNDASYWPLAVNNRQPFIKIAVLGDVQRPVAGRYTLAGGAPNRSATVQLATGTFDSRIRVDAITDGPSFNGLRVNVLDFGGTAAGLAISDRMSAVKYRSSYYDFKATIKASGTEPVQPSTDLETFPTLTADGTAQAPYLPWVSGSRSVVASIYPNVVTSFGGTVIARVQAVGTQVQFDTAQFDAAEKATESLDSLRAATRRIRAKGVGISIDDAMGFAAYQREAVLVANTAGTVVGSVGSIAPTSPYSVYLQAMLGTVPRDTFVDYSTPGTIAMAGDGFTGSYFLPSNNYQITVPVGPFSASGTVKAIFTADVGTSLRAEPSAQVKNAGNVSYLVRPEDQFNGTNRPVTFYDDEPWRRDPVFAGEQVDQDVYVPYNTPDIAQIPADAPYRALGLSGHQYELAVLDGSPTYPYRFKVLQNPETDPITGEALESNHSRLLFLQDANGALYPSLLIDNVLVSTQYWSETKWTGIAQWTPFNEHPLDSIFPYSRYATEVDSDIQHGNRLWSLTKGWYTRFDSGDGVTLSNETDLGSIFTASFWIRPEPSTSSAPDDQIIVIGDGIFCRLNTNGSAVLSVFVNVAGVTTLIASLPLVANLWSNIGIISTGTTISAGVGKETSAIVWTDLVASADDVLSQMTVISCGVRSFELHDLTIWSIAKQKSDMELLRAPALQPTSVNYPTTYVESLSRDNRYVMRLQPNGFSYPAISTVVTHAYNPAYAERYQADAQYAGDPAFKQVGLGDGDQVQSIYRLGLRGPYVEGLGRTLVSGSNPPLPGFNAVWGTNAGSLIRVFPPFGTLGGSVAVKTWPSSPWPNLEITNPTQDRIYVKGDDGFVYKVYLDDSGAGPALIAERTLRARQDGGSVASFRDQPTDAETLLASPGKVLSISTAGTIYTPYQKSDGSQTVTTPPVYLYRQSVVKVNALDTPTVFSRWANRTTFGVDLSIPALEENGSLDFANPELLPAGNYQLTLDVGNIGVLDDDFNGFSTTISVVGSGGAVLSTIPATLLSGGSGANARGKTTVNVFISSPISAAWLLTIDWNNSKSVPRKGQIRQLAVYGYGMRLISPALYQVSINPLTITGINTGDSSTLYPGGVFAEINSYGTVSAYRHEASVYPDNSVWPLSNLRTTSSWNRREKLTVINPSLQPDPTASLIPSVVSVAPVPNSIYNVGDTVQLRAVIANSGSVAAYVWRFWDSTVESTLFPQISKIVTPSAVANGTVLLSVFDRNGSEVDASTVVQINVPPSLVVSATRQVGIFPYVSQLSGTVSDPSPVTLSWFQNGTIIASGTNVPFTATQESIVTAVATDSGGGVTKRSLAFDGFAHRNPIVSPIIRNDTARISNTNVAMFAVYAIDPNNGGPLTFAWQTWAGAMAGTTTNVGSSNSKFNQISVPLIGQVEGQQTVRVVVTDQDGYSLTVDTVIELLTNVPPVIQSVTTPSPGALGGSLVPFAAVATDLDGDSPAYTWSFITPRTMTLFGGNVQYQTQVSDSGQMITGTLTVDDGNGGIVTADIPQVVISNQAVPALVVGVVPGFYQAGFNQSIKVGNNLMGATIRYTLDGTDVFAEDSGLEYTGQFAFLPPDGGIGNIIMKARGFLAGYAPSPQFQGTYQFFDPNADNATTTVSTGDIILETVQSPADSTILSVGEDIPGDNGAVTPAPTTIKIETPAGQVVVPLPTFVKLVRPI